MQQQQLQQQHQDQQRTQEIEEAKVRGSPQRDHNAQVDERPGKTDDIEKGKKEGDGAL
jgi:hypothetical protein